MLEGKEKTSTANCGFDSSNDTWSEKRTHGLQVGGYLFCADWLVEEGA